MSAKTTRKIPVKKKLPIKKSLTAKTTKTTDSELKEAIVALGTNMSKSMNKSLAVMTARIATSKEETDAKIAEANARMTASKKETDAKIAEALASMAASKKETDAKIAEANARMAASFDRLDHVVEKTNAQLAGLSDSSGRAVESLAYSFFDSRMTFAGVKFDDLEAGVNRRKKLPDGTRIQGEYDIVLYNGSAIALIEAKNRVRKGDVTKLIDEQLPRFKLFFPQYKDFKFYLGLCGMSFEDGVEKEALDMGIGTLKPNGDAVEINETTVKAW
jgi:hypothetical protein